MCNSYNVCDPNLVERSKIKNILHWSLEAGKDVGKKGGLWILYLLPS